MIKFVCPKCVHTIDFSKLGPHLTKFCIGLKDKEQAAKLFNKIHPIIKAQENAEIDWDTTFSKIKEILS